MYTAEFKTKSVYGKELIYPNNDVAYKFCKLIGKKTLSQNEINQINELGFKIILK